MEVEPLSIEELIEEATDINNYASNEVQAQAVSNQVNRTIGGANTVVKLLIQKIAMRQEVVTLQSLNVVESCVKNCGSRFHNEIGKYKFINELIKLLSSKYDGDITPQSIKDRVISLMYSWYVGLPHETKIAEAYKMLKQQGIIKRDPVDPNRAGIEPLPRDKENTAFHDEGNTKLLKTLLSSKDTEDLHSANKLIKNMVKEEEERLDRISKRIQVLETVSNNVKLLDDMIAKYDPTTESGLEIMNDLYERCLTLRPELFRLASKNIDDKDDAVGEILSASDELTRVIDSYKERVLFKKPGDDNQRLASHPETRVDNSPCLLDLDLNSPSDENGERIQNSLLDEQFKLLGLSTPVNQTSRPLPSTDVSGFPTVQGNWNVNPGSSGMFQGQVMFSSLPSSSNMLPNNSVPVFRPPNAMPSYNTSFPPQTSNVVRPVAAPPPVTTSAPKKDLFDFDIFDSEFLKPSNNASNNLLNSTNTKVDNSTDDQLLSLAPFVPSSSTIQTGTTPLVPLVSNKEKIIPPTIHQPIIAQPVNIPASVIEPASVSTPVFAAAQTPNVLPTVPNPTPQPVHTPAPVVASLPSSVPVAVEAPAAIPAQVHSSVAQSAQVSPVNYLVPLEALKTGKYAPIPILDKDGIKTFLMLAEDTREVASPNVIVSILSTISLNTNPLSAFSIQVAVPKIMRVKLQPPTSNDLAPFNPIFAPPSISQVMLIANPTKETVKLRFKITYSSNGVSHVETGNIDELPVR